MGIRALSVLMATVVCAACGQHIPEPAVAMPGTPHISWVIMHGDSDDPDREFACQSEPRTECVLPVSRPEDKVLSDLHVYYHGAGAETKYIGSIQIGYFGSPPAGHTLKTDLSVKKEERITNQSVSDIVTSKPGTYAVDFDIAATVIDTKKTQPIHEKITVVVK